eukprot:6185281-Pleurochrysis_carterae.AAC.2
MSFTVRAFLDAKTPRAGFELLQRDFPRIDMQVLRADQLPETLERHGVTSLPGFVITRSSDSVGQRVCASPGGLQELRFSLYDVMASA